VQRQGGASLDSTRHNEAVTIDTEQFIALLVGEVPELSPVLAQSVDEFDGLLFHLFIADVRRFAIAAHERGDEATLHRVLDVVDRGLTDGDESVRNAIAVSFVEDTAWWDPNMGPYISTWPAGLTAEVQRQRSGKSRE
jgi:hypothetical protein